MAERREEVLCHRKTARFARGHGLPGWRPPLWRWRPADAARASHAAEPAVTSPSAPEPVATGTRQRSSCRSRSRCRDRTGSPGHCPRRSPPRSCSSRSRRRDHIASRRRCRGTRSLRSCRSSNRHPGRIRNPHPSSCLRSRRRSRSRSRRPGGCARRRSRARQRRHVAADQGARSALGGAAGQGHEVRVVHDGPSARPRSPSSVPTSRSATSACRS